MDTDTARIAAVLADHALVLLACGLALIGAAAAGVFAVVNLISRHGASLVRASAWLLARATRLPRADEVLRGARAVAPASYMLLHLLLGLVAVASALGFAVIAEEVVAGSTVAQFDRALAQALQDETTPGWRRIFAVVTQFGSNVALGAAAAIVAGGLLLRGHFVLAAGWIAGQAGGGILNLTLKQAFARARPESADAVLAASSWSFPSAHAMGTFVFCGLGVYLLIRLTRAPVATGVAIAVGLVWCLVMAFTRLYLGVHYASDVVAGLIAATAWVAVCVSGLELATRGARG